MLLSPIGSPSKTWASLCIPLPPLTNEIELELRFPVELIFYIVELAAITHRRSAVSLCLVSSWVREAVLPLMYGTVVLHGKMSSPFDVPRFTRPRQLTSVLKHINHLWIDFSPERAPRNFDACTNLVQLAMPLEMHETISCSHFWRNPAQQKLDKGLDVTPCRSWTVLGQPHPSRWTPLTQSPQGLAFLRGLTHLRILNLCLSHYIPLEHTPHLTHLCIPFFDLRRTDGAEFTGLDYILQQPQIQMVVLTLNPRYWRFEAMSLKDWALRAMAKDKRLFVVASTRLDATRDWEDPRRDWEHEALGGTSIWDKAMQVRCKFLARLSRNWDS